MTTLTGNRSPIARVVRPMPWILAETLLAALSIASSGLVRAADMTVPPWITVTRAVLAGQGLDPAPTSESDFEHILSRPDAERAKVLSQDEFVTGVYEAKGGAVRFSDYPGDELVIVVSGSATLTDESSGKSMTFGPGDMFLVPKGWRGRWSNDGLYRELIVLGSGWNVALSGEAVASGVTTPQAVMRINPKDIPAALLHTVTGYGEFIRSLKSTPLRAMRFHSGDYDVMLAEAPQGGAYRFSRNPHEEFVYVVSGTATLVDGNGARASFRSGDAFVVTETFKGDWDLSPGYRAVVASVPSVESDETSSASATATSASSSPSWQGMKDPEALFAARCATCHNRGVVAPTLYQLSRLTKEQILGDLWDGVMQETANGLDTGQRALLAQWIAGINPDKGEQGPGVKMCTRSDDREWHPTPATDWPGWSRDDTFQRYVPDSAMTVDRVRRTVLEWALPLPYLGTTDGAGNQVAVVGDRVFIADINGWVYALDAKRGCADWTFRAENRVRMNVAVENGVLVFGDTVANAYGLDARTGKLRWRRRVDYQPTARVTGNVTLHDGVAYIPVSSLEEVWTMRSDYPCCSFRGAVVALDARTGRELWKTYTIDQPLRYLGKTPTGVNRYGPSGAPVWSGIVADDKRGVVYVTTGNQNTEPRVEGSDAVMALDMHTGEKRWVTSLAPEEMGGQDIYVMGCEDWVNPGRPECPPVNPKGEGDRDLGAPAELTRLADGTDLLLAATKDGTFYALDPDTGKVKWNVRVGAGGETGGIEYGFATDGKNAYLPVSDLHVDGTADGHLVAVDLSTGSPGWRIAGPTNTCGGKPPLCNNAYLSPPTVAGDVVWVGNQDGVLRAYDRTNGRLVWSYDTAREFTGVNGVKARGGSIATGGPVVAGQRIYVMSGWGVMNLGMPGNTLLSFEVP
jgi:polyvinyl alcohol dehydrogenase (cytochrome)